MTPLIERMKHALNSSHPTDGLGMRGALQDAILEIEELRDDRGVLQTEIEWLRARLAAIAALEHQALTIARGEITVVSGNGKAGGDHVNEDRLSEMEHLILAYGNEDDEKLAPDGARLKHRVNEIIKKSIWKGGGDE